MYDKLYEAARLDFESAKILSNNDLIAPAIYHCAQAVEKCSKAIQAYHMIKIQHVPRPDVGNKLRKKYGHNLLESTKGTVKSLLELYIESEVSQDKKKQEVKKLENMTEPKELDIHKVVRNFELLVKIVYDGYDSIINENYNNKLDEIRQLIKTEVLGENKRYLRYFFVILNLSGTLLHLEEYSRYPMNDLSYNNISLLNNINRSVVDSLSIMINDLVELVPDVWKQIDHFKSKIK